jgi:hypothetical protein
MRFSPVEEPSDSQVASNVLSPSVIIKKKNLEDLNLHILDPEKPSGFQDHSFIWPPMGMKNKKASFTIHSPSEGIQLSRLTSRHTPVTTWQGFVQRYGVRSQAFELSGNQGAELVTTNETRINVPARAFKDGNNAPATKKVTLQFKEILDKAEMILSDRPAMDLSGKILISDGEFLIDSSEDSPRNSPALRNRYRGYNWRNSLMQPINLRERASLQIEAVARQQGDMSLYTGEPLRDKAGNQQFRWRLQPNELIGGRYGPNPRSTFELRLERWHNVDRAVETEASHFVLGEVQEHVSPESAMFLIPDEFNSVVKLWQHGGNHIFSTRSATVPRGTSGQLLYISFAKGGCYYALHHFGSLQRVVNRFELSPVAIDERDLVDLIVEKTTRR